MALLTQLRIIHIWIWSILPLKPWEIPLKGEQQMPNVRLDAQAYILHLQLAEPKVVPIMTGSYPGMVTLISFMLGLYWPLWVAA